MASKRPADAVDVRAGELMRQRRVALGLSQTDVADALGLTFQQVQKYEKGTNRCALSTAYQIAQVLQVPPAYFFPRSDAAEPETMVNSLAGARLMRAYNAIRNGTAAAAIVALAESICDPAAEIFEKPVFEKPILQKPNGHPAAADRPAALPAPGAVPSRAHRSGGRA